MIKFRQDTPLARSMAKCATRNPEQLSNASSSFDYVVYTLPFGPLARTASYTQASFLSYSQTPRNCTSGFSLNLWLDYPTVGP